MGVANGVTKNARNFNFLGYKLLDARGILKKIANFNFCGKHNIYCLFDLYTCAFRLIVICV